MANDGTGSRPSPKTRIARQYFLYGDETGQRIIDPQTLAKKVGLHPGTIWANLKTWVAEHEKLLIANNNSELGVVLSDEDIEKYKNDTNFLKIQCDDVRKSIETVETMVTKVENFLKNTTFEAKDAETFLAMAEKFFTGVHTKTKLRTHWAALHRQWVTMSGIEGKMDIALTAEKARAVGRIKLDLKTEGAKREADGEGLRQAGGGLFNV